MTLPTIMKLEVKSVTAQVVKGWRGQGEREKPKEKE